MFLPRASAGAAAEEEMKRPRTAVVMAVLKNFMVTDCWSVKTFEFLL